MQQRQPKDVTNIMAYDIIENDGLLLMPSAITNLIQKLDIGNKIDSWL